MIRQKVATDLNVDRDVAALVVKVGNYPLHHGGVDAIRSLGRLGVPVYAVSEDRWTPAALSRNCRGRFVWPAEERADPTRMVERLKEAGGEIPGPAVLIPADEEAAVLIADAMRRRVRCVAGSPLLSGAFESSVPGVYFTGLASAATFGPLMRFVCGSGFAARRVSSAVAGRIRAVNRG